MARRQTVHLGRRQMHLRHADGQVAAEIPPESAQILVRPGRGRHHQWRLRSLVPPEAAAAGAAGAAPRPAVRARPPPASTRVYPCHVSPAEMRTHPIGTGPFKFVEFKANESIKLVRNENYFKKGLPHLDGIEFTIIPNRSTAILGFVSGKFDMTFPTEVSIPLLKDVKSQAPNAICGVEPNNVSTNIIINSSAPPFDDLDVRRALALALDRKAFISIMFEGQGDIGGTMQPAPQGLWAMPQDMLETIPGYGPDVNANREQARKLMQKAGSGPDK